MATLREILCRSALAVRSWKAEGRGIRGERVRLQVRERATEGLKYSVRECDGRETLQSQHTAQTAHARADTQGR